MHCPDFEMFASLARKGNVVPVYREILADTETPLSVLMKLKDRPYAFLLESVEGGEKWGRYTFIGADPRIVFQVAGDDVILTDNGVTSRTPHGGDPLGKLKAIMEDCRPAAVSGLPRFYGGAVGYLGYDMVRYFEKLPGGGRDDLGVPEAVFMITDTFMIFDNIRHTIKLVACAKIEADADPCAIYDACTGRIDDLLRLLEAAPPGALPAEDESRIALTSNMAAGEFCGMVAKAKEFITAGDIIQVVLSQRFEIANAPAPIDLYRALRLVNPSPYLFFLKMRDFHLIGSSPEVMVRLEEGTVELRPIAGTRRRGKDEQEDRALADELLQDPKERAEHVMLVDLGRNDLGRIAEIGSVQVNQLMTVERYSHVMHLVSNIQAQLQAGKNAFDVLKATLPAGTLSGAPKVRAMEIIDEMEPAKRGPYGGAVGYFSYTGNMDFGITIRTLVIKDGRAFVQAGAGIVADSDPQSEYRETLNKAEGMLKAVRLAANRFELME